MQVVDPKLFYICNLTLYYDWELEDPRIPYLSLVSHLTCWKAFMEGFGLLSRRELRLDSFPPSPFPLSFGWIPTLARYWLISNSRMRGVMFQQREGDFPKEWSGKPAISAGQRNYDENVSHGSARKGIV